jgi:hypothetical protein
MYYRTYYPREWMAAILKLEQEQPLLALCADHWKAEHVLGAILLEDEGDNENTDAASTNNRKRSTARKGTTQKTAKGEDGGCHTQRSFCLFWYVHLSAGPASNSLFYLLL